MKGVKARTRAEKKAFCSCVWCLIDTEPSFPLGPSVMEQGFPSPGHGSGIGFTTTAKIRLFLPGFTQINLPNTHRQTQGSCQELGKFPASPPPQTLPEIHQKIEKTQENEQPACLWMLRSKSQWRLGNSSAPASVKHIRPDYLCSRLADAR